MKSTESECGRNSNEKSKILMKRTMYRASSVLYLEACKKKKSKNKQKSVSKTKQQCCNNKKANEYCHGQSIEEKEKKELHTGCHR